MITCPHCKGNISLSARKGKAQQAIPGTGKSPSKEGWALASGIMKTIAEVYPESVQPTPNWGQALTCDRMLKLHTYEQWVGMAKWGLENGFTIATPIELETKAPKIIQLAQQAKRSRR